MSTTTILNAKKSGLIGYPSEERNTYWFVPLIDIPAAADILFTDL